MLIPSGEGEGMVNSQLVTQGNFNSPSRGLAVVVKKRIPTTRGSASRGRNLFFTTPAKPWLGELKLPFVTRWEFIIPTTRGFATCGRNYTIPSPPPEGITSFHEEISRNSKFCVSIQKNFPWNLNTKHAQLHHFYENWCKIYCGIVNF